MGNPNPVFEKNYGSYLQQLNGADLSAWEPILGVTVDKERRTAEVPFFNQCYRVSRFGVMDDSGRRPDYGTCVILLKYLLMCPAQVPSGADWINYRELKDAGQSRSASLADYSTQMMSKWFAGNLDELKEAVRRMGGKRPEADYPYDLAAVFPALPRIPILFLFNDADDHLPAQAFILYARRAEHFLDAECLVMVNLYLFEHLKKGAPLINRPSLPRP